MTATPSYQQPQPGAEGANTEEVLYYCDMLALSPIERQADQVLIGRLFGSLLLETRELADGYTYRFDGEHYPLVAEFITHGAPITEPTLIGATVSARSRRSVNAP